MEAIVFDFGTCGIKCGLAGQDAVPREFITWAAVERSAINEPFKSSSSSSAFSSSDTTTSSSNTSFPSNVEDVSRTHLLRAIRYCYRECLLMEPSQRKVLICDGPLMTMARKRDLADCFLRELRVPGLAFLLSHLMVASLFPGLDTALVVDCGHSQTTCLMVSDGRPMFSPYTFQTIPIGGAVMTRYMHYLLYHHACLEYERSRSLETCTLRNATSPILPVPFAQWPTSLLEDIRLRTSFFSKEPATGGADDWKFADGADLVKDTRYPLPWSLEGSRLVLRVPGWIRARCGEVYWQQSGQDRLWFDPNGAGAGSGGGGGGGVGEGMVLEKLQSLLDLDDTISLPASILTVLKHTPVDLRAHAMENIILAGGMSAVPGFVLRLRNELERRIDAESQYQELRPLRSRLRLHFRANPSVMAWMGVSLVGSLASLRTVRPSWEQWELPAFDDATQGKEDCWNTVVIPDWSRLSLRDETPIQ